jgi:hypothetical protein
MNTHNVVKYAQLVEKKRQIQDLLKELEKSITTHREAVLAEYMESGVQSLKVDVDGHKVNVFQRKTIWANAKDGDVPRAVGALKNAGLGFLVEEKFNTHTLSSWVREQLDMHHDLPAQLAGAIQITEKFDLGVNKS